MSDRKRRKQYTPHVWSRRTPAEWCTLVEEAGDAGLAVTEAAAWLGIHATTFGLWEKRYKAFGKAAAKVRENSARKALSRTERLYAKSEAALERALAHVRQKRMEEQARIQAAMDAGLIWTPEQLAEKVENLKFLRREARAEERARQKQRKDSITITTVNYSAIKQ